jgi:hypothetical protein
MDIQQLGARPNPPPYSAEPGQPKAGGLLRYAPLRKSGILKPKLTAAKIPAANTDAVRGLFRVQRAVPREALAGSAVQGVRQQADIGQGFKPIPARSVLPFAGLLPLWQIPGAPARKPSQASRPDARAASVASADAHNVLVRAPSQDLTQAPRPAADGRAKAGPGLNIAEPLLRAPSAAIDVLLDLCVAVYEGINSTGRGCRRTYALAQDACGALAHRVANVAHAGGHSDGAASRAQAKGGPVPDPSSRYLIDELANSMESAHTFTAVMEDFKAAKLTYDNLLYLIEPNGTRVKMDAEGQGLHAPATKDDSSLMRRLVTGAQTANLPWRLPGAAPQSALADAHERYLAYRNERYPHFDKMYARLKNFADPTSVRALKEKVEAAGKACAAEGKAFDPDAYILHTPLIEIPPGGSDKGSSVAMGVTAQALSDDIPDMRRCLADMAVYMKAL